GPGRPGYAMVAPRRTTVTVRRAPGAGPGWRTGSSAGSPEAGRGREPRLARRVREARLTGRRPTAAGRPWNRAATAKARETGAPSSTGPIRPARSAAAPVQATPASPAPPASAHAARPSPVVVAAALVRAPRTRSRWASWSRAHSVAPRAASSSRAVTVPRDQEATAPRAAGSSAAVRGGGGRHTTHETPRSGAAHGPAGE